MTPTNQSYTLPSGRSLYVGETAPLVDRPAWRTAMAINTWAAIPGNTLASINPENVAGVNPNYPAAAPWRGFAAQAAIIDAWCGACFDKTTCTLHFPLQGGHHDYAGNEPYRVPLNAASATFVCYRNPSGAVGNVIDLDAAEGTGAYLDGRLRSQHSYNNNVFVPGVGPVVTRINGQYPSGSTSVNKAYVVNQTTGEAALLSDHTAFSSGYGYGGGAYDAARGVIWMLGVGTGSLMKINVTTGVATAVNSANNYAGNYARVVMLDAYDLLLVIQNGGSGYPAQIYAFDLSLGTPAIVAINYTGSFSSGFTISGQVGADWNATDKELLLWNNATSRTEISVLHLPTDPRTTSGTAGVKTVAVGNTVTPTAAASNGTYGRFGYSSVLGGCFLLNAVGQQIYFFATE